MNPAGQPRGCKVAPLLPSDRRRTTCGLRGCTSGWPLLIAEARQGRQTGQPHEELAPEQSRVSRLHQRQPQQAILRADRSKERSPGACLQSVVVSGMLLRRRLSADTGRRPFVGTDGVAKAYRHGAFDFGFRQAVQQQASPSCLRLCRVLAQSQARPNFHAQIVR